jgi:hypothetical protein
MPPTDRPLPRFVAEPPHSLEPRGRWREALEERFIAACHSIGEPGRLGEPGPVTWFPERTYAGRTYVPATSETDSGYELFGYVSFTRPEGSDDPVEFTASADYTEETAATNPAWKLDLNDEVIGRWRGPGEATADLTIVWGSPLVPGGVSVTAELGSETVDQCALVQSERFTLVALDAVSGLGDDSYFEVKLWNRKGELLATESLYEEGAEEEEEEEEENDGLQGAEQ